MAVLEALAAGRPVIAPAAAGPAEIVDRSCGVLYEPGDARAAAAALSGLLDDPQRASALGTAGRARARREFDLDTARARYASVVAPLLRSAELPPAPGLALVTVTHNSAGSLPGLLASMRRFLPGVHLVVVDCDSGDDTVAIAHACSEFVRVIALGRERRLRPRLQSWAARGPRAGHGARQSGRRTGRRLAARARRGGVATRPSRAPAGAAGDVPGRLAPGLGPPGARRPRARWSARSFRPRFVPGAAREWLAPWRASRPRRVGWAVGARGRRADRDAAPARPVRRADLPLRRGPRPRAARRGARGRDLVLALGASGAPPGPLDRARVRRRAVRAAGAGAARRRGAPAGGPAGDGSTTRPRRSRSLLAGRSSGSSAAARSASAASSRRSCECTADGAGADEPRRRPAPASALIAAAVAVVAVGVAIVVIVGGGAHQSHRASTASTSTATTTIATQTPPPAGPPAKPAPTREAFGINVNRLFNDRTYTPAQIDAQLAALQRDRGDGGAQRRALGGGRAGGADRRRPPLRLELRRPDRRLARGARPAAGCRSSTTRRRGRSRSPARITRRRARRRLRRVRRCVRGPLRARRRVLAQLIRG